MAISEQERTNSTKQLSPANGKDSDYLNETGPPLRLRYWEVTLIFLVAPALIQYQVHPGLATETAVRVAMLVSAIRLTQLVISRHITRDLGTLESPHFARNVVVSAQNATILQQRAGHSLFSDEQAKLFALAVTTPSAVRQRVVDSFTPGRRTLEHRTALEAQLPLSLLTREAVSTAGPPVFHLPIIIPKKGKMLDNFHLWDASGTELSVLSYREYLDLAAGVLRAMLRELEAHAPTGCSKDFRQVERAALKEMIARYRSDPPEEESTLLRKRFNKRAHGSIRKFHFSVRLWIRDHHKAKRPTIAANAPAPLKAWEQVELLPATEEFAALRGTISAFVKILSESYCIVAAVKLDEQYRVLLTYQQTLIPELDLSNSSHRLIATLFGRLRIAMGTRPPVLTLAISNAFTCQSYHLRVNAGEDLYVSKQIPIDFESLTNRKAPGAPTIPHMRFQRRLGQPHAHFYARYMPEPTAIPDKTDLVVSITDGGSSKPDPKDAGADQLQPTPVPRIRFIFVEVPPGSLMRATVTAVAAAAIIWLIAFINKYSVPDTDAPAFLLTFPAIVAAWMGFESPAAKSIGGTLRARFALLLTAATSIAASGMFIAHKSIHADDLTWWPALPEGYSLLGINDLTWGVLVAISMANALYLCYKYYVFTLYFSIYSTREQPGSSFTQHG